MAHESLYVPKQSDKVVIDCFSEIAKEIGNPPFHVTALGGVTFEINLTADEPPEAQKALLEQKVNLIDTVSLNCRGLSLSFKKGGHVGRQEPPSPYFDEIQISYTDQHNFAPLSPEERVKVGATLIKKLRAFEPGRAIQGSSEEQNQLQALHQSMLERLESTATTLVENLAEFGQQLQTQFQENEAERSKELQQHKDTLDDEHKAKIGAINEREKALEKRIEEIDNRDNTHVRRELRRNLLDEIQKRSEKFKLTEGTNELRWPVHAACILGLLVIAYGAIFYANQFTDIISASAIETLPTIVIAIKQVLLTLGAVGLGFFYIRWLNRWFHRHANAEFELKQFQLDIDRASWLVETALEWKASEGDAIPDTLLTSLTRNLFIGSEREQSEQLKQPTDVIASALQGKRQKQD